MNQTKLILLFALSFALLFVLPLPQAEGKGAAVEVEVALANPVLLAGRENTAYLKVGLTGVGGGVAGGRAPVNVVLALDRSGSMEGEKIERAKGAALDALARLGADDVVSIVAYDTVVEVLLPATKLADRSAAEAAIRGIVAGGDTALFGGVAKAAGELRKFLDGERANRLILLSDGLANVGPSSPGELARLGRSLAKEGISVTTLGLGLDYNEDLMVQLAETTDGNHVFVQESAQLAAIFDDEFGELLSVVAQSVEVEVVCRGGVRPVRALGRVAEVSGGVAVARMGQLYGGRERYVLFELEVPAAGDGVRRDLATVGVVYRDMAGRRVEVGGRVVSGSFSGSAEVVRASVNAPVMVSCVSQIATGNNDLAVELRDRGEIEKAKYLLNQNFYFLQGQAAELDSAELREQVIQNGLDWGNIDKDDRTWGIQRKVMRYNQSQNRRQQEVGKGVVGQPSGGVVPPPLSQSEQLVTPLEQAAQPSAALPVPSSGASSGRAD